MASRAVSSRWQRAAASLIERVGKRAASGADPRPERLYHFTDCAGLIGIFEKRTIWASLATSLNDPSEVRYGLNLACDLFRRGASLPQRISLSTEWTSSWLLELTSHVLISYRSVET